MIAILKYNAGNVKSVENALVSLGYDCLITDDETELKNASKVIIPGVGEASSAMQYLRARGLDSVITELTQPVLGICLGLQLMCQNSEEGNTPGLGIFDVNVKRFPATDVVPHMGWNNLTDLKGPLYNGLDADAHFYFVHGYYAEVGADTSSVCNYILPFSASFQKNNFYAVQFHPEKSAADGTALLKNFLSL